MLGRLLGIALLEPCMRPSPPPTPASRFSLRSSLFSPRARPFSLPYRPSGTEPLPTNSDYRSHFALVPSNFASGHPSRFCFGFCCCFCWSCCCFSCCCRCPSCFLCLSCFFLSSYSGLLSRLLYLYAFLSGDRTSTTAKTRTLCVRSVTRVRSMRGEVPNRHI